jgi:hypothetical protein
MKNIHGSAVIALAAVYSTGAQSATWTAPIQGLQSLATTDCFYFTLNGITVAEPTLGNNSPWFAIPRDQIGAKDAYAMLLAAKLSGIPVNVITTGSTVCGGYAQVS